MGFLERVGEVRVGFSFMGRVLVFVFRVVGDGGGMVVGLRVR